MTTAASNADTTVAGPGPRPGRRFRRGLGTAIAVLIVVVVAGGGGWVAYAARYQPLGPGSSSGSLPPVVVTRDGLTGTAYLVRGSRGTVDFSIANNGGHAVRMLGLAAMPGARVSAAWAPLFHEAGPVVGTAARLRRFPATIPPHSQISLWITVTRHTPCAAGVVRFVDDIPLRWSALGFHHVFHLRLRPDMEMAAASELPIYTCYPAVALKHARLER